MNKWIKKLLQEAPPIDFGDTPNWMDPKKQKDIEQMQEPFSKLAAWPIGIPSKREGPPFHKSMSKKDLIGHYSELVASHVYPELMRKVQTYFGKPAQNVSPEEVQRIGNEALSNIIRLERAHKKQLESLAVKLVLDLPEFKDAKEAVEEGYLIIKAKLLDQEELQRILDQFRAKNDVVDDEEKERSLMKVEPLNFSDKDVEKLGLNVPEVAMEYEMEAEKRRLLNAFMQGAGISKNFAFHEVEHELNNINPNLVKYYGQFMTCADLFYWMTNSNSMHQIFKGTAGGMGVEYLDAENDKFVIHAYARIFPILVQELVKGLYEFVTYDSEFDPDLRHYAYSKTDVLANEEWDIMFGPGIFRHLYYLISSYGGEMYMGRVLHHFAAMPVSEFNEIFPEIMQETETGKDYLKNLIDDIKAEEEKYQNESNLSYYVKKLIV